MNKNPEEELFRQRKRVEFLDKEFMEHLTAFLEQRREVIASIASLKAYGTIPIRATDVEADKLAKRMLDIDKVNPGLFLRSAVQVFWAAIFAESVELQSRVIHAKRRKKKPRKKPSGK